VAPALLPPALLLRVQASGDAGCIAAGASPRRALLRTDTVFWVTGAGADASAGGGPPVLRVRITNAASGAVRLDTRFPLDFLPGLAAFVPQARVPPRHKPYMRASYPICMHHVRAP